MGALLDFLLQLLKVFNQWFSPTNPTSTTPPSTSADQSPTATDQTSTATDQPIATPPEQAPTEQAPASQMPTAPSLTSQPTTSQPTAPQPSAPASQMPPTQPDAVQRKVMLIIFNPIVPDSGGKRLSETMAWNDPDSVATQYIDDLRECSYGYAVFNIEERHVVDGFPAKTDGYAYTCAEFLKCWQAQNGFHVPDTVDYAPILAQFGIPAKINSGAIDEVWMFGPPYSGFNESVMAGPDAFFCNAAPLTVSDTLSRRFIIMGFSYQRAVGEMLESMAHRVEFIMKYVCRSIPTDSNLWQHYELYDLIAPGKAEVGSVHFAPNSLQDYQWGSPTYVMSRCDTWYHFPDLSGDGRMVNCSEWGGGDIRAHHRWWMLHLPHVTEETGGIANNWWLYAVDPDQAK